MKLSRLTVPEEPQRRWVEKFLKQLDEALEWQSPGSISWRFQAEENWLRLAPCLLELVGGANNGESVYPFYSLNVSHLIEIFDDLLEMSWNTMYDEFSMEGQIDGEDAWITFSREPFDDEQAQDAFDP
jgi:hypothetical protein